MTDLENADLAPDLESCASEPIRVPGAVQPHGVLLAVSEPDLVVRVASANAESLLGVGADALLGKRIGDAVDGPLVPDELDAQVDPDDLSGHFPVSTTLTVHGQERLVDAVLHRSDGLLVIEIEPGSGPLTMHNSYRLTRTAVGRIHRTNETRDLYRIAVEEMRRLTGFDRVMIYRFDREWNGEVVEEDKTLGLNSFLGLRYPASDIPAQARALYRENWLRLIADVGYRPAPLVPATNPLTGRPLDLSHATLRSVSPVHVEYLRNMGVSASMSVSLLDRGELWGLIACHHYSGPHRPPYEVRAAAEFLGQTLSLRLLEGNARAASRHVAAARASLAALSAAVLDESRPAALAITEGHTDLLTLVGAGGATVSLEGRESSVGVVPHRGVVHALVDHVAATGHDVLPLDRVPDVLPELAAAQDVACGALVLRLSEHQHVVWFRSELVQTVDWGGDPHNQAIAVHEGDTVRMSPRKSFERWQEVVRGRSEPWTAFDVQMAGDLRHDLLDALYTRSLRLATTATTLQRSLLPDQLPEIRGWTLAADYRPSVGGDVGGDWYDVVQLSSGPVVCVLGDVAGHGIAAAGTMGQLRNGLRAYLVEEHDPGQVLQRLSRLTEQLLPFVFATATIVVVDPDSGSARVASAGHPPVCLVPTNRPALLAPIDPSPPLGVLPEFRRPAETSLKIAPGDALVLYSDGLVERRTESVTTGLDRLTMLSTGPTEPARLCRRLMDECRDPAGEDDATVLVLRRNP